MGATGRADFDVAIIGGGAVGLACAAVLAAPGRSVLLLERNAAFGQETSSRNSGVIHAGLYYPRDSLKAALCYCKGDYFALLPRLGNTPRYDVDSAKAADFGRALRLYLPEVTDADLSPNYAGVRPKLQGPGEGFADFVVEEASGRGLPGLVNLIGIESPGLTASEAVAQRVASLLGVAAAG